MSKSSYSTEQKIGIVAKYHREGCSAFDNMLYGFLNV